jgi:hypothetical protein
MTVLVVLAVLAILAAFPIAALRFGADTRDRIARDR